MLRLIVCVFVSGSFLSSCSFLHHREDKKGTGMPGNPTMAIKTDTTKKSNKIKPYTEVITAKAVTDKGVFLVHKVEDRYFFEIPDTLLNRDILVVNRISKAASGNRPLQGMLGYAGDNIGENVIRFIKGPNYKLFIVRISYSDINSKDSSENGMFRSVRNNNLQPIVASFDIKALHDSTGIIIDVTDYVNGDNDVFFFSPWVKNTFGLGAYQVDKSYIQNIVSYPLNMEIRTVKTYINQNYFYTYELNSSMVLLPNDAMKPRYRDERVGYFSSYYYDFDVPQGWKTTYMITRWRLEPKDEDAERYRAGQLVEPKNPIVFYIDPATPKKWVPYLIQGVNDWKKAFEKAGFKNAIYALEAPVNDSEWNLEDARHNAIVYKPSWLANASGPNVHDPRTGEILEAHINWYHNVMELLHDWYFVQASPSDKRARKMEFDDELMGQLIRFVCSHEVGHSLGLLHNFGASSAVPVEKLRDKKWVEENGFCPSIMDYARFNYVAQPGDSISERGILPRIGVYDEWAIEWGYRWFPNLKDEKEEKAFMSKWISNKTENDRRLWFGSEQALMDPRCQSEDLGDNAVKASYYGIKNLRFIAPKLIDWTKESDDFYESLKRMQGQIFTQYQRYLLHVVKNVGGVKWTKNLEQKGPALEFVRREEQKKAVQFLQEELFTTPTWLLDKNIFALIGGGGYYKITELQQLILSRVISNNTLGQLLFFEGNNPNEAYRISDLFNDLENGIWGELKDGKYIDLNRRGLQKAYVGQLLNLRNDIGESELKRYTNPYGVTDILSIARGRITKLLATIKGALPKCKDAETRLHLMDIKERLETALHSSSESSGSGSINENALKDKIGLDVPLDIPGSSIRGRSCWSND